MASTFDYIKLAVENSKIILPLLLLLMSATGYTVNDNFNKSKEIKATQEQLTNVANFYAKPIVKQKDCCSTQINSHEREHH